jgi:Mn2+/Fe2+ NRAMP family transporter
MLRPPIWPYIVAVLFMAMLGVVSIVTLTILRPKEDNLTIVTLILGFLAPTTLSLLSLMKAQEATNVATETHKIVNSELEKWKKDFAAKNFAQGQVAGLESERGK